MNGRRVFGLKVPGNVHTQKRQRTLRSLYQRTHECARGRTCAVWRGYFRKVPSYLPTGYSTALSFTIPSCKIPADLFLFFFYKAPLIYAAGSDRANREPNITSEARIEHRRVRVRSPVVSPVAGCVGGYNDVQQNPVVVEPRVALVVGRESNFVGSTLPLTFQARRPL